MATFYALPRCAFLGDLVFREPTIGQTLWFDKVSQRFDLEDDTTLFFLRAFSLTREYDKLPDWTDAQKIKKQLKAFCKTELRDYTPRQVVACINYALNGADPAAGEEPPPRKSEDGETAEDDTAYSAAVGVVHEGQALRLGISLADAYRMTESEMQAVIVSAKERDGYEIDKAIKDRAIGDYFRALDEIKQAHKNEAKDNG